MGRYVASLTVFFVFFCFVQCQWNHLANQEVDSIDSKGLRTLSQGQSSHKDDRSPQFPQDSSHIRTRSRRRTRQALLAKAGNAGDEPFAWNHRFTIEESQPTSLTKETAYIWQDNTKRLKHTLEKDAVFQFINPTGLRISIPANSVNMRILEFRVKLNDEFRGNDAGHFAVNSYKRSGAWVYEVPQLRLGRGDRVNYWMRLALSKEAFDVVVKGVLEITRGNPHITSPHMEAIPFRPQAPVLAPQTQSLNSGLSPTLGGGSTEAFVWNHQFTINATYSNAFTKESASAWLQHAEFIKRFLQKHIDFKFLNPSGLIISIPDDSINIADFRIKLNDEFKENDSGHFQPSTYKRDNMWTYYIPQLRVQRGDRVYYWMRVKRNKDGFDAIVRGVLEINQGNPHTESSFTTSAPYQYPQSPPVVNTQPPRVQPPIVQPPIEAQRPPVGSGQAGVGQPSIGAQQPAVPSEFDRFGGDVDENSGAQAFNWEHKFVSINLNNTFEAGLTQDSASWAQKIDEYFKKTLERDIKFQFFNPAGLNMILSGDDDNFRILTFQVKLNEEFVNFDTGNYLANITRRNDGRWNYYYPNLKLKQGDKVHYWMRVTFGKDMWYYIVKGLLEISWGDPHNNPNSIRTTTPAPRPTATYVDPDLAVGGQPVRWEHKYTVNKTNSDGSSKVSSEDEQLLKNMFKKDISFRFLNPSGLSILFSGQEEFRLLAFNVKLNDDFKNLGPGDYIANVTRTRDGRLNYYYPNLKVKLGDKVYYWMRVMLGKELNDYIVKGELKLKEGDPHIGGPVPDVPPPIIYTQAPPRPTEPPVAWPDNQQQPVDPATATQQPVPPNNPELPTQTPLPFNEPLNKVRQSPYSQNQPQQRIEPLPLSINPPSSVVSGVPTRLCADGTRPEGSLPCQEEVMIDYRFNKMDGTHQITIGAKNPARVENYFGNSSPQQSKFTMLDNMRSQSPLQTVVHLSSREYHFTAK